MAFLTVISMERLYAIAWPFRHRAASTRVYIYRLILATWSLPTVMTVIYLCSFTFQVFDIKIAVLTGSPFLACALFGPYSLLVIGNMEKKETRRSEDRKTQTRTKQRACHDIID